MRRALTLVLGLVVGACSDGPEPGSLEITLSAPVPVTAAVVEVAGGGVLGVEEVSGGWIESHPLGAGEGVRVVVVDDAPGTLSFRLRVADLSAPPPRVTVLEASDPQDRLLGDLGTVQVRIR